jgi:hypothetical protein
MITIIATGSGSAFPRTVVDPCHFGLDTNPRIRTTDLWIRIQIRIESCLGSVSAFLRRVLGICNILVRIWIFLTRTTDLRIRIHIWIRIWIMFFSCFEGLDVLC